MPVIHARHALLPDGWTDDVAVTIGPDGRIASVLAGQAETADARQVETLLPAPANLHSHTFQRAMAGLAERRGSSGRDSFWTWREIMYRFLELLAPDEIEAIAAFAFMEMQEDGFGSVAEFHYLHHRPDGAHYDDIGELSARIAAAADATGIGLTLLPVLYRQGGVDGRALKGGQLRFGNDLDGFARIVARAGEIIRALPEDAGLGIAPHSLRAVSPQDLTAAASLLPGRPLHMHIAEQEGEVDEMLAVHGARPMAFLLDNFAVDPHWCLIHCTHMTPGETERLARTGAVAGLCPVTEANLGDGIFDGARYLAAGGRFGIGTDSNIRIELAGELRQFEYAQRLRDRARVVLADPGQSAGRRLFDGAVAGGAQALGRACGAIEIGRWADLVSLESRSPLFDGGDDLLLDAWIFGTDAQVADVWSAGRHVVHEGRHRARDAIVTRYAEAMRAVRDRL